MIHIDVIDILVIALAVGVIFALGYLMGKHAGEKKRIRKGWN